MAEPFSPILREFEHWLRKQIEEDIDVGTYDDALRDAGYEIKRLKEKYGYD